MSVTCIKFENGLRLEIKQGIGYLEIHQLPVLLNKCRIYDQDTRAKSSFYKSYNEKKDKKQDCGKSYSTPTDKGKQRVSDENKPSGGGALASTRCFKCGELDHRANDYTNKEPKKDTTTAYTNGRVFALSGLEDSKKDNLIRGTYFINNVELVAIIDTGATQLFISIRCATMMGLKLSFMSGSMVIDTLANGFITIALVYLSFPLTIYGKSFMMDLLCLPLHQIDVILGMNWLEFNYVHINCYSKTMRYPEFGDGGELMFLSAKQVDGLLEDETQMFAIFSALHIEREVVSVELLVVYEFPEVFRDDISDLPLEREVEFAI
ncbi:uncharacterized protein LOC131619294 [Vicia villosa]|uniref:uncharacterized protein LOC131619294 n=1 Tax=Vicia villosa TaxID=3911 RepID=UPI00273B5117|nr:uncharacterized protein LOC131619294 [Vicia villosa]